MREPVVILAPDGGSDEQIQRGDICPPAKMIAAFQSFCVLIEHAVDDMDECFISREKPVTTRKQISFQPSFKRVLTEHFHYPAVR